MLEAGARGTGLIVLAVLLGVVLLQLSDDNTAPPLAAGREAVAVDRPARATTTTSVATTTTTAAPSAAQGGPAGDGAPARDLTVLVLNASGRNKQAGPLSDRLAAVGYTTLPAGNAPLRGTSSVLCRKAHAAAAAALGAATGLTVETGELDEDRGFAGAEQADCVVVVGAR